MVQHLVSFRKGTGGGRCCSVSRGTTFATRRTMEGKKDTTPTVREEMTTSSMGSGSVNNITNRNIPSNDKVAQNKSKMDAFTQKLQNIKLKKQNITFKV